MGLEKTKKQPFERYFVYGDFAKVMDDDETLDAGNANTTVTAIDLSDDSDATGVVIDTPSMNVDNETKRLYIRLIDGVDGKDYQFTIRVETSIGNRWEVDGILDVDEV